MVDELVHINSLDGIILDTELDQIANAPEAVCGAAHIIAANNLE